MHNKTGIKFRLPAKEEGGAIGVRCTDGTLEEAWLVINEIADARDGGPWIENVVDVKYRRGDEREASQNYTPGQQ